MTSTFVIVIIVSIIAFFIATRLLDSYNEFSAFCGVILLCCSFAAAGIAAVGLYENTDHMKERATRRQAQEVAEREPRIIRRVDGCEVYAFKDDGQWHYFTRCSNKVETK